MKLEINTHGNSIPERAKGGDWYDLQASETVELKAGEIKIIPLGISISLPKRWTGYILPRSSTAIKYGLLMANSMGIIDNTYCGDDDILGFPVYATKDVTIQKGTRIARFAAFESPNPIKFIVVEALGNANRSGFGSTGL